METIQQDLQSVKQDLSHLRNDIEQIDKKITHIKHHHSPPGTVEQAFRKKYPAIEPDPQLLALVGTQPVMSITEGRKRK